MIPLNSTISKIIIFTKRKMTNQATDQQLQGKVIRMVDCYVYLCMVSNYNGRFGKAREKFVIFYVHSAMYYILYVLVLHNLCLGVLNKLV